MEGETEGERRGSVVLAKVLTQLVWKRASASFKVPVFISLFVCLFVCLFVSCLFVCLLIDLSIY